jgi:hypothetical protein
MAASSSEALAAPDLVSGIRGEEEEKLRKLWKKSVTGPKPVAP